MPTIRRAVRLSNPKRVRAKGRARRSKNAGHRRRRQMTAKQIRFFGTKRQKNALKHKRKRTRRNAAPRAASRPRSVPRPVKAKAKRRGVRRRSRSSSIPRFPNSALLVTLGANPKRRKKNTMAHRRRRPKSGGRVHNRRRRRNRSTYTAHRRRRANRSYRRRRARNPLGSGTGMALNILSGLAGVAVVKAVPRFLPGNFMGGGPVVNSVVSVISAWLLGRAAHRFAPTVASAAEFGGYMQAGSVILNNFMPQPIRSLALAGGLGEWVPGKFTVPQNPVITSRPPVALPAAANGDAQARTTMHGVRRAFGMAF